MTPADLAEAIRVRFGDKAVVTDPADIAMIICTIVLALLALLVATESDANRNQTDS